MFEPAVKSLRRYGLGGLGSVTLPPHGPEP